MPLMGGSEHALNLECPKIVSAVLKALRGDWDDVDTMERLAGHVARCQACSERIAGLDRFVQFMKQTAPQAAGPAAPPSMNRRTTRRLVTNEAVNLVLADGSVILARMIEVSARGARLESPEVFERDAVLTLNRGRRSIQAAVRHCKLQGGVYLVGVEYMRHASYA